MRRQLRHLFRRADGDILRCSFAISDNYYTSAEVSVQGHVWTAFGRTFDFDERQWFLTGYGGRQVYNTVASQPQGVIDTGRPVEGSVFDWMAANKVPYDAFTEALALVSAPPVGLHNPLHLDLPGGPTQGNITYPDVERACFEAAHMRVFCDLGNFVYALLLNDHTSGVGPERRRPRRWSRSTTRPRASSSTRCRTRRSGSRRWSS